MTHWTTDLLCVLLAVMTAAGGYLALRGAVALRARLSWIASRVRGDPVGATLIALFVGGMIAWGGGKTNQPPIIIPPSPVYIERLIYLPDMERFVPVWTPLRRVDP